MLTIPSHEVREGEWNSHSSDHIHHRIMLRWVSKAEAERENVTELYHPEIFNFYLWLIKRRQKVNSKSKWVVLPYKSSKSLSGFPGLNDVVRWSKVIEAKSKKFGTVKLSLVTPWDGPKKKIERREDEINEWTRWLTFPIFHVKRLLLSLEKGIANFPSTHRDLTSLSFPSSFDRRASLSNGKNQFAG